MATNEEYMMKKQEWIQWINEIYRDDENEHFGETLKNVGEFQDDEEVVLAAVRNDGRELQYASERLKGNKEIVLEAVREYGIALVYASEELKGDKEVVLEAVRQYGRALVYASEELKGDKEVVLEATRQYGRALVYASEELKGDKEFVLEAVAKDGRWLEYVSEELKGDKEVVLEAVREYGIALVYASEELKGDKEVVLEAVRQYGRALVYASEELKGDKEVVLEAVRQDGWALNDASEEVKGNKEVVLEAVRQYGRALACANEKLKGDKEVILEAVRQDESSLHCASKQGVLEAIKEDGRLLGYVCWELKEDKEVVLEAVRQYGRALAYASEELKGDKEVVLEAVKQDKKALKYVSEELLEDESFVLEIIQKYGVGLKYASEDIKKNRDILKSVSEKNPEELGWGDKQTVANILKEKENTKWQEKCLETIRDKENVLLSSPTGSGKTSVFLEWAKQKEERPIYITAPIKALSNQRYRELMEQGYVVGIETGDIKNVPENADFICCTQEIYTNKYMEQENATLIVDEFHYIFENQERARTYINALYGSKAKNILLCSATFGDMEELEQYIQKVSNRDFFAYENKERLTPLYYKEEIESEEIENALVVTFSKGNCEKICDTLAWQRQEKELQEGVIEEIARKYKIPLESDVIQKAKKGLATYYGDMFPKEKLMVEELFEKRMIDTVVGTDALAVGVNFPVQNVVFAQLAKYNDGTISRNLFEQLAGRAGRKGFFEAGYVYYCEEFGVESYQYNTHDLYDEKLEEENENVNISLQPEIGKILRGTTSIEQEVDFMQKYSTMERDKRDIEEEVRSRIQYITEFDVEEYVLTEEFAQIEEDLYEKMDGYEEWEDYDDWDDYEEWEQEEEHYGAEISEEQENEFEHRRQEIEQQKEVRRKQLIGLNEEFHNNIAKAYFDDFDDEKNCKIFADILVGKTAEELKEHYTRTFRDILQLRKYINALPKEYRKRLDSKQLYQHIVDMDETVLDIGRGLLTTNEIAKGVETELVETEKIQRMMQYFEKQQEREKEEIER